MMPDDTALHQRIRELEDGVRDGLRLAMIDQRDPDHRTRIIDKLRGLLVGRKPKEHDR